MPDPAVAAVPAGLAGADTELGAAIEQAHDAVAAASQQLNLRANDVFNATSAFIADFVAARLEAIVLGQPERTAKLGAKGIERLKADLAAWQKQLPVASAKHLRGAFAWTFPQAPTAIGEAEMTPLFLGDRDLPWMMGDAIRTLAAEAGELARGAGYEVRPASHWDIATDGAVRRYLEPFDVAPRVTIALRSYSDARLRYFRTVRGLRRLEAQKAALDARIEAETEREAALAPARWLWGASTE
jgi:hypothetical protein